MNQKILRIIDANINRITEGLRVIEEVLRFFYDESEGYKLLRKIRHEVPKIFYDKYTDMISQRESSLDPGIHAKEKKYENINQLVISNFHRVTESLRVLEEISKLIKVKEVQKIKNLRYKVYDLEKKFIQKILK